MILAPKPPRSRRIRVFGAVVWKWTAYSALAAVVSAAACRTTGPLRPVVGGDDPASRTASYLVARGDALLPGAVLVLDYQARKFELPWAGALVDPVRRRLSAPEERTALGIFARMIDPVAAEALRPSITSTIAEFESVPTTYVVLQSLYCDWSPAPSGFLGQLLEQRPGLRHWRISTLMAYAYMKSNRCIEEKAMAALGVELLWRYGAFLDGIVDSGSAPGGEFVETVGGLYFGLGRGVVAARWVEYLIRYQAPDGTWDLGPDEDGAEDLTATWGLLAILEHFHPDAPPISPIP